MFTFLSTAVNDTDINKVKNHDEKPEDQRELFAWITLLFPERSISFLPELFKIRGGIFRIYYYLCAGIHFLQFLSVSSCSPYTPF